jgi:very-short-patch-repair endonuclease
VDLVRLNRIAARQRGLFTRAVARGCGFTGYQIKRRVDAGEWRSVVGPVLAFAGLEITPLIRDRALQLAVPGSVLAGPSAARALRIPIDDPRSCLLIGPHRTTRIRQVTLLHGQLDPRDQGAADGVPVTWYERTIVDCLRLLDLRPGAVLLDLALQRRWVTLTALSDRIRRESRRWGTAKVAALVHQAGDGARSEAERLLHGMLAAAAVEGWQPNLRIDDDAGPIGVGDVVFPRERLVIEVDGWAFHTTAERVQSDRSRQNRLISASWAILRFTWRDLTERPDEVIQSIQAFLAMRSG